MTRENRAVRSVAVGGYLYSAVSMPLALTLRLSGEAGLLVPIASLSLATCLGLWIFTKAMKAGWVACADEATMRYPTMIRFVIVGGAINFACWVLAFLYVPGGPGTKALGH